MSDPQASDAASTFPTPPRARRAGGPVSTTHQRRAGAFHDRRARAKYWVILITLLAAGALFAFGLLTYKNPVPIEDPRFWLIAKRRMTAVTAMAIVAVTQSFATVAFQTVTNNRIITPSIMGFESLYRVIHTATIFFFGAAALNASYDLKTFIMQMIVMVGMSLLLYGWLLTGKRANMHVMLLVGIILGGGLGAVSTFMQRLLTPSDFDILTARLFGSVNNASAEYFPVAIPTVLIAAGLLFLFGRRLNVMALGRDPATNLGLPYRPLTIATLVLVAILVAVSTALVGPMTFLGFLVATLAYQAADTYDHRYLFPMAAALAFAVLTGAYFLMTHVFYAQGVVSILIEFVGGLMFLIVILRKGRL